MHICMLYPEKEKQWIISLNQTIISLSKYIIEKKKKKSQSNSYEKQAWFRQGLSGMLFACLPACLPLPAPHGRTWLKSEKEGRRRKEGKSYHLSDVFSDTIREGRHPVCSLLYLTLSVSGKRKRTEWNNENRTNQYKTKQNDNETGRLISSYAISTPLFYASEKWKIIVKKRKTLSLSVSLCACLPAHLLLHALPAASIYNKSIIIINRDNSSVACMQWPFSEGRRLSISLGRKEEEECLSDGKKEKSSRK